MVPGLPEGLQGPRLVCVQEGGRGRRQAARESARSLRGGRVPLPHPGPNLTPQPPRLAAPTIPVVESAAAAAALPSPHTDNMAAAEEETHDSAASRRDQSEAAATPDGSGSPFLPGGGAGPFPTPPPAESG